jgi:hypothetical protein
MKGKWIICIIVALVCFIATTAACSTGKKIPKRFYQDYKSAVLEESVANDVRLSFIRPGLTIMVNVPTAIGENEMEEILELTKSFVTVDKINEIAEYVNWNWEISYVELVIMNEETGESQRIYEADYFKTNDKTDDSPENIDGYKTWRDSGLIWKE